VFGIRTEGHMPDIRDKPDRGQWMAARGNLHRPFQCGADGRSRRSDSPLEPKTLNDVSLRSIQITKLDHVH
jgi:hypothetical protein